MKFWNEKEPKKLFQKIPFYNVLIEKHQSNIDLLHELPFYNEIGVVEISKAFKGYGKSYKIEIIIFNDPLAQLETSKSTIEDFFKDLSNEMKGFKYQITIKILL